MGYNKNSRLDKRGAKQRMTAMLKKRLPVGIENFEKIRRDGFYYVDKTDLIKELLENWGEVNLFTRPRRFGKTLNMSMFQCFFDVNKTNGNSNKRTRRRVANPGDNISNKKSAQRGTAHISIDKRIVE